MRLAIALSVLLFLSGCCAPKAGRAEFYDVVKSHREITPETVDSVIASIKGELASRDDLGEAERRAVQDLLDRLSAIKDQSIAIYEWVEANEVDSALISELIRTRWTQGSNNGRLQ